MFFVQRTALLAIYKRSFVVNAKHASLGVQPSILPFYCLFNCVNRLLIFLIRCRHQRRQPCLAGPLDRCPGPEVVGEDGVGPDEDLVLDRHPVPDQHRVLDGDARADHRTTLDERVVADIAVRANHGPRQHVGEGPDPRAGPHAVTLAQALRVDEDRRRAGHHARADATTPTT